MRAPLTAPRLRWSKPIWEIEDGVRRYVDTIRRLGKSAEAIVDTLERAGGEMRVEDLAAELGIKRPRDMRRRVIARLEAAGVVECFGSSVRLCRDWLAALERREEDEEIADYERDKKRYEREREDYRLQVEVMKLRRCGMEHGEIAEALEAGIEDVRAILGIPDYAPTEAEMEERRRNTPERRREAIETAVVRLFRERPEYRSRRVGQITCRLTMGSYLPGDFPRGSMGAPKDHEVAAILEANGVETAA